jgi:dCMP deaminase
MKQKFVDAYMDVAERFATLSSAVRLKVGAIVVKDNRVISIGYNGMPSGWDNVCENKDYMVEGADKWLDPGESFHTWPYEDKETGRRYALKTKPEVLHAETNAIAKLAQSVESGVGAAMFVTHAPCIDCAKLVYQTGISSVYYRHQYRDDAGIHFLRKAGVEVIHYDGKQNVHSDS